jgi:hypothetical protein
MNYEKMTAPCGLACFNCIVLHPYADKASELPHNTKVFNLCLIKRMGLESWAKDKAKKVKNEYFQVIGNYREIII